MNEKESNPDKKSNTLYFIKDSNGIFQFGIRPPHEKLNPEYQRLSEKISLKEDLKWKEQKNLQTVFRKAIWKDFPIIGLKLIAAEQSSGAAQRFDLLYLDEDGGLIVCELKIGEVSIDVHGQIIRYISCPSG